MDEIVINRDNAGNPASITFGTISVNGVKKGVTLEPETRKISKGTYSASIYNSPKFGRKVILLEVPGRSYIEIHAGNTLKDTSGCILVGKTREGNQILNSSSTLKAIISSISTPKEIQVRVK